MQDDALSQIRLKMSDRNLARFLSAELDTPETRAALSWLENEFGVLPLSRNQRAVRAIAAVKVGAFPETVARHLDWQEFEAFGAALLRAKGFGVVENIILTRPRVQVDLLARSPSVSLVIDCKHWTKTMGQAGLARAAAAQAKRAMVMRKKMGNLEPIFVVILVLSNEQTRYVDGAAVVPIYALGDFLDNLGEYSEGLTRY